MKGFISLLLVLITSISACAQFSSSETVYCYKYEYTSNDGIRSKKSSMSESYYFVNFQNDMMGYTSDSDLKRIRQRMLEDPSYYKDAARNNLANSYSRWKRSPAGEPTMGPAQATAEIIKYDPQYSKGSKYTYRYLRKYAQHSNNIWDTYGSQNYWSEPTWQSWCYTFSSDKSELIIWSTSDPENRDYYKRIYFSELTPNTDFLY